MNYSPELKEAILRRMLPPNNEPINKIAKQEGIADCRRDDKISCGDTLNGST